MAEEFELPNFLKNQSVEEIHQRMLSNLPDDIDKSGGGFVWDFTRPTAIEKAEMVEFSLQETMKLMFPQYAYGKYLDLHAETRGITRKPATSATGSLTVSGKSGTVIAAGSLFATVATNDSASIQFEAENQAIIKENGNINLPVKALETGTVGNVSANTIVLMVNPLQEVTAVTNPMAFTGGVEAESDEDLRIRIKDYDSKQGLSFVGSISDYKRWALEVAGVGSVNVISPAGDDGIVTIVITDSNACPASDDLIKQVYDHIMRPDSPADRLAPVNAAISVIAPKAVNISVTAIIQIDSSTTTDKATEAFKSALKSYYHNAVSEGKVKFAEVGALLIAVAGIEDYSNLQINGGTSNVEIRETQMPITESVVLTT